MWSRRQVGLVCGGGSTQCGCIFIWPGLVPSGGSEEEEEVPQMKEEVTPVVSATGREGLRAWLGSVWFGSAWFVTAGYMSDWNLDLIGFVVLTGLVWVGSTLFSVQHNVARSHTEIPPGMGALCGFLCYELTTGK